MILKGLHDHHSIPPKHQAHMAIEQPMQGSRAEFLVLGRTPQSFAID